MGFYFGTGHAKATELENFQNANRPKAAAGYLVVAFYLTHILLSLKEHLEHMDFLFKSQSWRLGTPIPRRCFF